MPEATQRTGAVFVPAPSQLGDGDGAKPRGITDFVVEALSRALFEGRLEPGQRLSPGKLATELGVSHIPVREALTALESAGHVTHIPRRGYFVPRLAADELEDVYHWRQVLEDDAHRIALPVLTDADIEALHTLNAEMQKATRRRDGAAFGQLNRSFHFVVFARAGSPLLLRFLDHLWDHAARYQAVLLQGTERIPVLQDQHDSMMDVIVARDVETLNRQMAEHRDMFHEVMRERLLGERP